MIDRVYRTVQSVLNKEQRGYLTPEEFNNLAQQAQNEIFELYFHDFNYFLNAKKGGRSGSTYADLPMHYKERINKLSMTGSATPITIEVDGEPVFADGFTLPTDLYRLTNVIYNGRNIEEEDFAKLQYAELSPLAKATEKRPVFTRLTNNLKVYPSTIESGITVNYIRTPKTPKWTYINVNGVAVFNGLIAVEGTATHALDYQDFELHEGDEHEIVIKILSYAGIIIREPDVVQAVSNLSQKETQDEFRI